MYENLDVPWMRSLFLEHPTIGHMPRRAGYYTAYKGKWHLSRESYTDAVEQFMTPDMEKYGFVDNFCPGDLIGHTLDSYSFDRITADGAINWLRTKGMPAGRRDRRRPGRTISRSAPSRWRCDRSRRRAVPRGSCV
jgi:arylsulfatase A-like enzyme